MFAKRWLETVSSTWVITTALCHLMLQSWYQRNEHVVIMSMTQRVTIATVLLAKTPLITIQKRHGECFVYYQQFKVAINPTYRIFFNFAKSCVSPCLSNVDNIKNHRAVFELWAPKAVRVFLASDTVAMVTYCVTKMVTTCQTNGQFFDTMIVASSEKEW